MVIFNMMKQTVFNHNGVNIVCAEIKRVMARGKKDKVHISGKFDIFIIFLSFCVSDYSCKSLNFIFFMRGSRRLREASNDDVVGTMVFPNSQLKNTA